MQYIYRICDGPLIQLLVFTLILVTLNVRSNNICIALGRVKLPFPKLREALIEFDLEVFDHIDPT